MKKRMVSCVWRLVFPVMILASSMTQAQESTPNYYELQKVNPYKQPLYKTELLLKKEFKGDDAIDGWRPLNHISQFLLTDNDTLFVEANGVDPYFLSPELSEGITGNLRITIRMKSDMGPYAQIFVATVDKPQWRDDNDFAPRFEVHNDKKFHNYAVFVSLKEDEALRLRIDPGNERGTAEIESVLIEREIDYPIDLRKTELTVQNHEYTLDMSIRNYSETNKIITASVVNPFQNGFVTQNPFVTEGVTKQSLSWKNEDPFLFHVLRLRYEKQDGSEEIQRVICHIPENLEQVSGPLIENDQLSIQFDDKYLGAVVRRKGQIIGTVFPLAYHDDTLPVNVMDPEKWKSLRRVPSCLLFRAKSKGKNRVELTAGKAGTLKIQLVDDEIRFSFQGTQPVHGPVFRPLGSLEQGLLSGVEYLGQNETSSSTADIETMERIRYSPKPLDMTMPFAAFVTDQCSMAMLWENPETNVIYATPDFINDASDHRMNIFGDRFSGTVRVADGFSLNGETLEKAILWAVQKRGIPNLPKTPRTSSKQHELNLKGLTQSSAYIQDQGWKHAFIPNAPDFFPPAFSSDMISTIWQLTGKLPEFDEPLTRRGAHLPNDCVYFVTEKAEIWLKQINAIAEGIRKEQKPDGSFRYNGKYLKGHFEDTASGYCGHKAWQLMMHYRWTGNKDSLDAALSTLSHIKRFRVPRGAQTWELSLHTPDIMGSAWCSLANTFAYEATGESHYLEEARRWALTGLPFVYQWSRYPVMLYATTPVFGATNWTAPNWIGLPVQWCGLDYGEALFELAKHDNTLDWKKIATGILISAEQQQYIEGDSIGLLPDSFTLSSQRRNPADINPVVMEMQRRRLEGKTSGLANAIAKDIHVVSPYPVTIEDDQIVVEAKSGVTYQIVINGKDIRTIVSKGRDVIELKE